MQQSAALQQSQPVLCVRCILIFLETKCKRQLHHSSETESFLRLLQLRSLHSSLKRTFDCLGHVPTDFWVKSVLQRNLITVHVPELIMQ